MTQKPPSTLSLFLRVSVVFLYIVLLISITPRIEPNTVLVTWLVCAIQLALILKVLALWDR